MNAELQPPQPLNLQSPVDRLPLPTAFAASPKTLTILGSGAWGTALAELAQLNSHRTQVWSRSGSLSLEEAILSADVILSAVSMKGVPETIARLTALSPSLALPPHVILVSATKGLDAASQQTPSQLWHQAFPHHPLAVLSGPNLSAEILQGLPSATVVASQDPTAAATIQRLFASDRLRVYTNTDPLGTELGGTLKNVIAIAVGVCDGLNLGTNARSALITRALVEIIRIGTHLGGRSETFCGLSGLGDLLATCTSPLSRNYRVGYGLALGHTLAQVLTDLQSTAEGVNTTRVLHQIAQQENIPTPIAKLVYLLLENQITPQQTIEALMERDLKPEDN